MENRVATEYSEFLYENRKKVNRYLNTVLWFFVITGPAIAVGIKGGIFGWITYSTCIWISVIVIVLAGTHLLLLKKFPKSPVTGYFALTALDLLLVFMSCFHVKIYLTWFLVPLLSLLFCDRVFYIYAISLNFVLMGITTWITSGYYASLSSAHATPVLYFSDIMSGFTIETLIMFASGTIILQLTVGYFKRLFSQHNKIHEQNESMEEKIKLLGSMAEIYDNVYLIDFVNNTETSLRDSEGTKYDIDLNSTEDPLFIRRVRDQVMPDQLDEFAKFTNIKTVRTRLAQKKIISADFIDVISGWFRAQYITVESTTDGVPDVVIFTTRNVDEEKRREENLIRISMTDEMTRLFNRRCFDEDLKALRNTVLTEDFVLFSVDVNGLKTVNDTKGHAAGDELIKGAADCLALSVGKKGKIFRTGGDEFMAIVHTEDPEKMRSLIMETAAEWRGVYSDEITMSIGYASHKDRSGLSVDELEHIADADMYAQKDKFYKERGIDRRTN